MNKMMKPEMEVVRFGAEDVIATSEALFMWFSKGNGIRVYTGTDKDHETNPVADVYMANEGGVYNYFTADEIDAYHTATGVTLLGSSYNEETGENYATFAQAASQIKYNDDITGNDKKLSQITTAGDNFFIFNNGWKKIN